MALNTFIFKNFGGKIFYFWKNSLRKKIDQVGILILLEVIIFGCK